MKIPAFTAGWIEPNNDISERVKAMVACTTLINEIGPIEYVIAANWVYEAFAEENECREEKGLPAITTNKFMQSMLDSKLRKQLIVGERRFNEAFLKLQRPRNTL